MRKLRNHIDQMSIMRSLKPSAELAAIVSADPLPRTEVIKKS